jgi:hypothetical protein
MAAYSDSETKQLEKLYTENPCLENVRQLSTMFNRSQKSIISKLVRMGVYEKRGYRTKAGEVPITKLELVRRLEDAIDTKLPGLDKAPKSTLQELSKTVVEAMSLLEDISLENADLEERVQVLQEMINAKK